MASRSARAFVLGALVLTSTVAASQNYSMSSPDIDALRAQLALMDNRPKDCPPWCVPSHRVPFHVPASIYTDIIVFAASTVFSPPLHVVNMRTATPSTGSVRVPPVSVAWTVSSLVRPPSYNEFEVDLLLLYVY